MRPEVTTREFDVILKMGEDRGVINGAEEDFLQGVMDMREVKVSEIMTPRVEVSSGDVWFVERYTVCHVPQPMREFSA